MSAPLGLAILGSTGSVGRSTLSVVALQGGTTLGCGLD
jgi:1-deoxy-D-xylulose 5-phosphate reductoisomerase